MAFRFSPVSGSGRRRTLTVLVIIALIAAIAALIFIIRINHWNEKREFGEFIAIVDDNNEVRRDWDDFTLLDNDILIDSRVADSLERMMQDCRLAGGMPVVCLSYISAYRHTELFEVVRQVCISEKDCSGEQASEYAAMYFGAPGHSEHQLGTALDIFDAYALQSIISDGSPESLEDYVREITRNYEELDFQQRQSITFAWLVEHSWEYGFILRYPNGSEEMTGKTPNSWHFRYVGEEAARQIYELGITLEEYNTMFFSK